MGFFFYLYYHWEWQFGEARSRYSFSANLYPVVDSGRDRYYRGTYPLDAQGDAAESGRSLDYVPFLDRRRRHLRHRLHHPPRSDALGQVYHPLQTNKKKQHQQKWDNEHDNITIRLNIYNQLNNFFFFFKIPNSGSNKLRSLNGLKKKKNRTYFIQ